MFLSLQVGNLFGKHRSTVITLYNGAFDSSSAVFLVIKVGDLLENGKSRSIATVFRQKTKPFPASLLMAFCLREDGCFEMPPWKLLGINLVIEPSPHSFSVAWKGDV